MTGRVFTTVTRACATGAELLCGRHVSGLYCRGASWEVQTQLGHSEQFDAVVLTMPVPQILQLQGNVANGEDAANTAHVHGPRQQPAGSPDPLDQVTGGGRGASPADPSQTL